MPDDTSPHGGEVMHPLPDRAKIPEPKPGAGHEERERSPAEPPKTADDTGKPSVTQQPGG